ncbi:hypothetical protein, partial [Clostridium sp.]|uniref:hypothetical protein n=1 Tax=Clostridium sp. TaxID=1506 RepID=UPI003994023F
MIQNSSIQQPAQIRMAVNQNKKDNQAKAGDVRDNAQHHEVAPTQHHEAAPTQHHEAASTQHHEAVSTQHHEAAPT